MSSLKDRRSTKIKIAGATTPVVWNKTHPAEVVIGRIVDIRPDGAPIVDYPENPAGKPIPAMATARYDLEAAGRDVALMFISGDPSRPLAIGVVAQPGGKDAFDASTAVAEPEIVLQCGRASIVLTRAGKVLLRGAYLSLRSTGMQRITGASVHIN